MAETTERKEKVTVIVKEPGKAAKIVKDFPNTLREYQKTVEGYIESVPFPGHDDDIDIVMNDEGKVMHLDANIFVPEYKDIFVGTLVVVGCAPDLTWESLDAERIEYVLNYLKEHECVPSPDGPIEVEQASLTKSEVIDCIMDWICDHDEAKEDIETYLNAHGGSLDVLKDENDEYHPDSSDEQDD